MSEMRKDGAVRCSCGSTEVVFIKTAAKKVREGMENLEDTYECRKCKKRFSRIS
jgi:hypothetical protein